MAIEQIIVPDIGDFDAVEVIEVLVKPGDRIELDDSIVTLESDKASMEIPATSEGIVAEVRVAVGDKVAQGALLVTVDADSDDESEASAATDEAEFAAESPAQAAEEAPAKPGSTKITADADADADADANSATAEQTITVPDIGDFNEVEVIEVLVKPGDSVEQDGSLITLESDKASMEIPSTIAGEVVSVAVVVGDKVAKGSVIAVVRGTAVPASDSSPAAADGPVAQSSPESPVPDAQAPASSHPRTSPTAHFDDVAFVAAYASPAVRKFARELGVNLAKVTGTGRKGRILKEDVQGYVKQTLNTATAPSPDAAVVSAGSAIPPMPEVDFSRFGEVDTQPLTKINRLTGETLRRSWLHVPHVTQFDEADITELDAFRKQLGEEYKSQGVKITMLAFLLKACAAALKTYPRFCSSLDSSGQNLVMKQYCHIGIAVDTPAGLVVPVIRDVDKKSLLVLAEEMQQISVKAREKKLTPGDMQGGCFTISSLGGIGGTTFTPIVNSPEVAILGVSRAKMQPEWNGETFVPRLMLPLALSYDHRVIDGADGARFTTYLAKVLADTRRLLL